MRQQVIMDILDEERPESLLDYTQTLTKDRWRSVEVDLVDRIEAYVNSEEWLPSFQEAERSVFLEVLRDTHRAYADAGAASIDDLTDESLLDHPTSLFRCNSCNVPVVLPWEDMAVHDQTVHTIPWAIC